MTIDKEYLLALLLSIQKYLGESDDYVFDGSVLQDLGWADNAKSEKKLFYHLNYLTKANIIEREDNQSGFGLSRSADASLTTWSTGVPIILTASCGEFIERLKQEINHHLFSESNISQTLEELRHLRQDMGNYNSSNFGIKLKKIHDFFLHDKLIQIIIQDLSEKSSINPMQILKQNTDNLPDCSGKLNKMFLSYKAIEYVVEDVDRLPKAEMLLHSKFHSKTAHSIYLKSGGQSRRVEDFINEYIYPLFEYLEQLVSSKVSMEEVEVGTNEKKKIFIVHGSNHDVRNKIRLFLFDDFQLESVVMDAEANYGRTLPEKFEQIANECAFAIFVMTADDCLAYRDANDTPETTIDSKQVVYRFRQNVVLEAGYFWAKLGREKCVFLVERQEGLEMPSDIQGVGWIPITPDLGETRTQLTKELKKAGLF